MTFREMPPTWRLIGGALVVALTIPLGFLLTTAALHTHWPVFGFIPHLDLGLAVALTAATLLLRKTPPPVRATFTGLALGAWITTAIFGGFISV